MRLTSKGQVTIPAAIRERVGLHPGTPVEFDVEGDTVKITRAAVGEGRGARIVQSLRAGAEVEMTTDEIMALTRGG